jgi:hypothetical protein
MNRVFLFFPAFHATKVLEAVPYWEEYQSHVRFFYFIYLPYLLVGGIAGN